MHPGTSNNSTTISSGNLIESTSHTSLVKFSVTVSRTQTSAPAVYATEVSREEYLAYTTEETEKVEVMRLADRLGGDIEQAISRLARGDP